jgi:hypothetical protein
MPSVIARDSVAADHLVYAWPFPIGPEDYEVSCADDELVVMCPSWTVGDRLGPGRHRWRTPDPMRPVSAFFVLTAPVEVSFDMTTSFMLPIHNRGVRLRATGSLQVRCTDPALLVAQFVGLPFDNVNDGILRSVSRSVERMLARLLTRRVVMGATPMAVTDPGAMPSIVEELIAYNPAAGAVFGIELIRLGHLSIYADDGSKPYFDIPANGDAGRETIRNMPSPVPGRYDVPLLETVRAPRHQSAPEPPAVPAQGTPPPAMSPSSRAPTPPPGPPQASASGEIQSRSSGGAPQMQVSGEIGGGRSSPPQATASGEIGGRSIKDTVRGPAVAPGGKPSVGIPPIPPIKSNTTPPPIPTRATPSTPPPLNKRKTPPAVEVQSPDEETQPGIDIVRTPLPGSIRMPTPPPNDGKPEARGAIMGIGTSAIGDASSVSIASGEIPTKVSPGARVLVPGPNGLMQSATVRQLLQGYYELEVGSSGETIWVPINGVVPE